MTSALPHAPHVVVTGSSGAIGGAVARLVRARRSRARLTLVDRDQAGSARLAAELGGDAGVVAADLSRVDDVPAWLARAVAERGRVDGLVNCAGFMDVRRFDAVPWADAWRLLAVDLVAPLRLMQLCVADMRAGGFVVNVASMAGRVPLKGCAFYGAAKAGLAMASEIARTELAGRGVHVVTVYPGPVASALERGARAQYGDGAVARAIPTGQPDALARLVIDAVERRRARVIYPSWYGVGWYAGGIAARIALAVGPEPAQ